jgi:hypothetical protein
MRYRGACSGELSWRDQRAKGSGSLSNTEALRCWGIQDTPARSAAWPLSTLSEATDQGSPTRLRQKSVRSTRAIVRATPVTSPAAG